MERDGDQYFLPALLVPAVRRKKSREPLSLPPCLWSWSPCSVIWNRDFGMRVTWLRCSCRCADVLGVHQNLRCGKLRSADVRADWGSRRELPHLKRSGPSTAFMCLRVHIDSYLVSLKRLVLASIDFSENPLRGYLGCSKKKKSNPKPLCNPHEMKTFRHFNLNGRCLSQAGYDVLLVHICSRTFQNQNDPIS